MDTLAQGKLDVQQSSLHHVAPNQSGMAGLSLNVPQFEVMSGGYSDDPFYAASVAGSSSLLMPPNMDSPNYAHSMDYGQQQVGNDQLTRT